MCNCSKPITANECEDLIGYYNDQFKRFFIFHISDKEGLIVRMVPKGINPATIAEEAGFYNSENELEFYHIREHPCIQNYENIQRQ